MTEFVSERFGDGHDASEFESGQPTLDEWLRKSARDSDGRRLTATYVWHRGDGVVVGYYTLAPWMLERETLSGKRARGLPRQIPCYLIAKLALAVGLHKSRLGVALLAEAADRAAEAASDVGGRYIVVDALDDEAASFYAHQGFDPVPGVEGRLLIPVKDVVEHSDRIFGPRS